MPTQASPATVGNLFHACVSILQSRPDMLSFEYFTTSPLCASWHSRKNVELNKDFVGELVLSAAAGEKASEGVARSPG